TNSTIISFPKHSQAQIQLAPKPPFYFHDRRSEYRRKTMGTLGRAVYTVGFWIRETGQALYRLGCRLQGNQGFREQFVVPSKLDRAVSFEP
ncbi:hypothetical protein LINPERHAP2_LOCUS3757, partial [Linum perenne]